MWAILGIDRRTLKSTNTFTSHCICLIFVGTKIEDTIYFTPDKQDP